MLEPHLQPGQTLLSAWPRAPDVLVPSWLLSGGWLARAGQQGPACQQPSLPLQAHQHGAGGQRMQGGGSTSSAVAADKDLAAIQKANERHQRQQDVQAELSSTGFEG